MKSIIFSGRHTYYLIWDDKGKRYECTKCGAIIGVHAITCQENKDWLNKKKARKG